MKVVHLVSSRYGGTGIAANRLNHALIRFGIESELIARDNEFESLFTGFDRLLSSTLTVSQRVFIQRDSRFVSPINLNLGKRLVDRLKNADVIHLHSNYNLVGIDELLALDRLGKQIVFTLHDERRLYGGCHYSHNCLQMEKGCTNCPQTTFIGRPFVERERQLSKQWYSALKNLRIICPSEWMMSKATKVPELERFMIQVIPNPVPEVFIDQNGTHFQSKKNQRKTVLTFISAELNNPIKNFTVIKDALSSFSESDLANFKLNLIGRGEPENLPFNLECSVRGTLTDLDVSEVLKQTDILIVPSFIDNSPNVISEALMAGCFVIGSNTGGIVERLKPFGMPMFNPSDSGSFAKAMKFGAQNHNRGNVAQEAEKVFGYMSVAKKVVEFYKF